MSYDKPLRRPATIMNDFKYPLPQTANPVDGAQFPALWTWEMSIDGSRVFFKVRDGIWGKDDPNAKLKEVEMNIFQRGALMFYLEEAITNPDFSNAQYQVKQKSYDQSSKSWSREPYVVATFTVIRRKAGDIRVHYRRSTYELTFLMSSEYIHAAVRNENGEYVNNPGLASRAYTRAFINATRLLDEREFSNYQRKDKEKAGGDDRRPASRSNPPSDPYDEDDDF